MRTFGEMEDTVAPDNQLSGSNNGDIVVENGISDGCLSSTDGHDQLVQTVIELRFQNEYLKSQFEGFKNFESVDRASDEQKKGSEGEAGVKELQEMVESLNKQLLEEKQTRVAVEEALKHLQVAHLEADAKAQELSVKLVEGQICVCVYSYLHCLCVLGIEKICAMMNLVVHVIVCESCGLLIHLQICIVLYAYFGRKILLGLLCLVRERNMNELLKLKKNLLANLLHSFHFRLNI